MARLRIGACAGAARGINASLKALAADRVRVVAGLASRLLGFVVRRFAPRSLARRVAVRLYRPPTGKRGETRLPGAEDELRREDVS